MSQLIRRVAKKGFTLIELMIVVAIIGILAAIAIPKFADLITKSRESSVKGSLGSVRGAITIYYSDTEGIWPGTLSVGLVTGGKYLDALPGLNIPAIASAGTGGHNIARGTADTATAGDDGHWYYSVGTATVNCTEVDTKGSIWSSW